MLDLTALDDAHLGALSRALHEARFCLDNNDAAVWASPLVVDLHVWAREEQRSRDHAAGRGTDWAGWLSWSGRDEANTVVRRLRSSPQLLDRAATDPGLLRDVLRPF